MKKSNLLLSLTLLFFGISNRALAYDPAPQNEIFCTADLFQGVAKIPITGLQPFSFSLPSQQISLTWNRRIEKIQLVDKYSKFYSTYWILPDQISPFPQKIIGAHINIENSNIDFILSRFPQSEKRKAGMSLEYNVARGFYGAYLLSPATDGPLLKIQAPVKFDEGPGILAVDCLIK